jgi:hypothetical protein
MAKRHGAREQKRLAKQKSKRAEKRRQHARRESHDPTIRLQDADRWPVSAALIPDNLWSTGIGNLVIARRMPGGRLACGLFLVDVFCLGVKDATWKILSESELKELRKHIEEHGKLQDVPPEYFAKLIYRAVDYAQSLGFPPHRDFRHAQRLLAGIDPSQCPDEFEFGENGRPHYVAGPKESPLKARSIVERVAAQGGHYTLPLSPSDLDDLEILDDDYEYDDEFEDDEYEDDEFEEDDSDEDDFENDKTTPPEKQPNESPPRRWWLPWR